MASNAKSYPAYAHFWGLAPREDTGPKAMPIDLDFSSILEHELNLWQENSQHVLPFVQSVWVDNYSNPDPLIIVGRDGINHRVMIPAFSQATRPLFLMEQAQLVVTARQTFEAPVRLILLNVPVPIFTTAIV